MNRWFGWIAGLVMASTPGLASAQAGADDGPNIDGTGSTYTVEFVDDALTALGQDTLIPRIVVRPRAPRTTLIRPRTSFVTELLKSADSSP